MTDERLFSLLLFGAGLLAITLSPRTGTTPHGKHGAIRWLLLVLGVVLAVVGVGAFASTFTPLAQTARWLRGD